MDSPLADDFPDRLAFIRREAVDAVTSVERVLLPSGANQLR